MGKKVTKKLKKMGAHCKKDKKLRKIMNENGQQPRK